MLETGPINTDAINHNLETDIEKGLATLPKELLKTWRDKYDEAEDLDLFYKQLSAFLDKRESALESNTNFFHSVTEDMRLEIRDLVREIKATFGNKLYFLGNGRTAEVYESPRFSTSCVKYIHDQEAYNEGNSIRTEYGFLCDTFGLVHENVRTPKPIFVRVHPVDGHTYGMEKVHGKNLSQILEFPEKCPELIALAKTLDRKKVVEDLINFIHKMHNERSITHNDLFMRNIMLDHDGNFFIIDFGKAKRIEIGSDLEDKRGWDLTTIRYEAEDFFKKLDKLSN